MIKRLTPAEAYDAILIMLPQFANEFAHFAPVRSDVMAAWWPQMMVNSGAVAYGIHEDNAWRGVLLGSILPDLFSGVTQGLEFFWMVEKAYRGERSQQLLEAFEQDCKAAGAQWVVIGMSSLAAPEKRRRRYAQLGYGPHCETYMKRI